MYGFVKVRTIDELNVERRYSSKGKPNLKNSKERESVSEKLKKAMKEDIAKSPIRSSNAWITNKGNESIGASYEIFHKESRDQMEYKLTLPIRTTNLWNIVSVPNYRSKMPITTSHATQREEIDPHLEFLRNPALLPNFGKNLSSKKNCIENMPKTKASVFDTSVTNGVAAPQKRIGTLKTGKAEDAWHKGKADRRANLVEPTSHILIKRENISNPKCFKKPGQSVQNHRDSKSRNNDIGNTTKKKLPVIRTPACGNTKKNGKESSKPKDAEDIWTINWEELDAHLLMSTKKEEKHFDSKGSKNSAPISKNKNSKNRNSSVKNISNFPNDTPVAKEINTSAAKQEEQHSDPKGLEYTDTKNLAPASAPDSLAQFAQEIREEIRANSNVLTYLTKKYFPKSATTFFGRSVAAETTMPNVTKKGKEDCTPEGLKNAAKKLKNPAKSFKNPAQSLKKQNYFSDIKEMRRLRGSGKPTKREINIMLEYYGLEKLKGSKKKLPAPLSILKKYYGYDLKRYKQRNKKLTLPHIREINHLGEVFCTESMEDICNVSLKDVCDGSIADSTSSSDVTGIKESFYDSKYFINPEWVTSNISSLTSLECYIMSIIDLTETAFPNDVHTPNGENFMELTHPSLADINDYIPEPHPYNEFELEFTHPSLADINDYSPEPHPYNKFELEFTHPSLADINDYSPEPHPYNKFELEFTHPSLVDINDYSPEPPYNEYELELTHPSLAVITDNSTKPPYNEYELEITHPSLADINDSSLKPPYNEYEFGFTHASVSDINDNSPEPPYNEYELEFSRQSLADINDNSPEPLYSDFESEFTYPSFADINDNSPESPNTEFELEYPHPSLADINDISPTPPYILNVFLPEESADSSSTSSGISLKSVKKQTRFII